MEKIALQHKEYFKKRVSFSVVHSLDLPLQNLHRFFGTHELVKKRFIRYGSVNVYNTSYYERFPYDKKRYRQELKQIFTKLLEKMRRGEELSGYETALYSNFKDIGDSLKARDFSLMGGACQFDSRLYLDAHGRFHICEKMNNTFSFGDAAQGFDFKKMAAIIRDYCAVVRTHCSTCSIRFLCQRCFLHFAANGVFELNPRFCQDQREAVTRNLEKFIECKEEGLV